jgi:hypothetical protein
MSPRPIWLPDMVNTDGDFHEVLRLLYDIFEEDIISGACSFEGRPVWWDRRKTDWANNTYDRGFLHLISREDYSLDDRLFDPRRSERLPWCSPTICNASNPEVLVWDYEERKKRIKTYIWLRNWDYVVIVEKKPIRNYGTVAFLVTAYHIDGNSSRKNLTRKYENRI